MARKCHRLVVSAVELLYFALRVVGGCLRSKHGESANRVDEGNNAFGLVRWVWGLPLMSYSPTTRNPE